MKVGYPGGDPENGPSQSICQSDPSHETLDDQLNNSEIELMDDPAQCLKLLLNHLQETRAGIQFVFDHECVDVMEGLVIDLIVQVAKAKDLADVCDKTSTLFHKLQFVKNENNDLKAEIGEMRMRGFAGLKVSHVADKSKMF